MIDFVRDRIGSGRAKPTNVLRSNNLLESSINSFESIPFDTSMSVDSESTVTSSSRQLKEWNCDEVQTFLRINRLEKFLLVLPANADGSDLWYLYSMCAESKNDTFEKIKETNPNIKFLDYLAFVKALRNLAKET